MINEEVNEIPEELLNDYIIGIDLGTTRTCVAIWRNGSAEIIPDEYGNRTIPSYVAYTNTNRYIGYDAKRQQDINIKNVFYEVKRLIGRKIDEEFVQKEKEFLTYDIVSDEHKSILLKTDVKADKLFTPEEISAAILTKAKQMACDYLKRSISKCVITVPAHFNDGQRQATKDAAKIAGLDCIRIINEPTAAALSYGLLERTITTECKLKTVLVYDFGGGTLDVSLLTIENGTFDVIGTAGNMKLGGTDFDNCLIDYCIKKFQYSNKDFDLGELTALSLQKLRMACEQAKHLLSTVVETHIAVKDFYKDKSLCYKITRQQFEKICNSLFMYSLKPVHDVLKHSDVSADEVDEIILVGGMTKVPRIRELLKIQFKKDPNCSINPDEAVAAGAAIQAYLLSHYDDPFSEAVTLLDSTALSLGVETIGGIMNVIIKRGEMIPTFGKKIYTTDTDYVDTVKIKVYEGERVLTKDNFMVGEFELTGIPPQQRGLPEIEVSFNIDVNGIITVTAINNKTNDSASMAVTSNKGRLTKAQIDSLIEESRELEIRDEFEKRKKWMFYEIEELCSNICINMKNKLIRLSENEKNAIKDDINKIISWLKEKPFDEREEEEYSNVLKSIKSKYTILIIKSNYEGDANVKESNLNKDVKVTNIHGDDDPEVEEMEKILNQVEDEELGTIGMSDPDKEELKELRKGLLELCDFALAVTTENNTMSREHITELRDQIDDILIWVHACREIKKEEYIEKIDLVNNSFQTVFDHYKEKGIDVTSNQVTFKNKQEELEYTCYKLKFELEDGMIPIKEIHLEELKKEIDINLSWLYENIGETNETEFYQECEKRLDIINNISKDVYIKMQNINVDVNTDIFKPKEEIIVLEEDQETCQGGTSIFDIVHKNQKSTLEKMIIND
jgi:molecular chaperone DnaK (HSP70)